MSNITTTTEIVSAMESAWNGQTAPDFGTFHFGTPQEVDNIHNKALPMMMVYIPDTRFETKDIQSSQWLAKTNWTVVIYNNLPSTYNVTDDQAILGLWDTMENLLLLWYSSVCNTFENNGQILNQTAPLNVTRLKEASNDRLLGLKATFGLDFYRGCLILR